MVKVIKTKQKSPLQITNVSAEIKEAWREQSARDGFNRNLSLWLAWLANERVLQQADEDEAWEIEHRKKLQ